MEQQTSKKRRSQIEHEYYKRPTVFTRWRAWLALAALVMSVGWVILSPYRDRLRGVGFGQWKQLASPGEISSVHKAWEVQCEACHVPFTSINDSRSRLGLPGMTMASDQNCLTCHAGPAHHPTAVESKSCGDCHREHQGLENRLSHPENAQCTHCHQSLTLQRKADADPLKTVDHITAFDTDSGHHPEFPSKTDPGQVRFNHAVHMAEGLVAAPGRVPFTFNDVSPSARFQYSWNEGMPLTNSVQLTCLSCHEFGIPRNDPTDYPEEARRTSAAYPLPVKFESHCVACHSLAYDPDHPERSLTHRNQPAAVIEEIRTHFLADKVARRESGGKVLDARSAIPPRALGRPDPLSTMESQQVEEAVFLQARRFFGGNEHAPAGAANRAGCVGCHFLSPSPGTITTPESLQALGSVQISPSSVPAQWWTKARFDHSAHHAVSCTECHSGVTTSRTQTDVLLPDKNSCLNCHGPVRQENDLRLGGVEADCATCHRYHDLGTLNSTYPDPFAPAKPRTILDVIQGADTIHTMTPEPSQVEKTTGSTP